jgi:hypothetical protein
MKTTDYFNLPSKGESNLEKKVKKASSIILASTILVPTSLGLLSQNTYAQSSETGKQEHKISIEEQKKKEGFFKRLAKGTKYILGIEDEKNPSEYYTVQVLDRNGKIVQEYKHIDDQSKLSLKNIPSDGMVKFIPEQNQKAQPQVQTQEKKTAVPAQKKDYTIYPLDVWVGDEYLKLKHGAEIEVPYDKTVFIKPQKMNGLTTEVMLLFPQKNLNLNDKYYTDDKGYITHRTGPLADQRVIIKNERIDLEEYGIRPLEEIFVDDTYETKTKLLQTVRIKLIRGPEPVPQQPVVTEEDIEPPWNPERTYPSRTKEKKKKHKEPKPEVRPETAPEDGNTIVYLLGGKVARNFSGTCKDDVSLSFTSLRAAVEHAPKNNLLLTAMVDADVDLKRNPCENNIKSFASVKVGAFVKPDGVPFGVGLGAGAEMQKNKTEATFYDSYFSINSNNYFADAKAGLMTGFDKDLLMYAVVKAGINYHTESNGYRDGGFYYDRIPLVDELSWTYGAEGKLSVGRKGPVSLDVTGSWTKQTPMSTTINDVESSASRPELGHIESWAATAMLSGRIMKNLSISIGVGKGEGKVSYKNGHTDKGEYTRVLGGVRARF